MAVDKRVLITGPIFDTPSGPSGQGGKLYTALKDEGYTIYKRSNKRNRILRLIDTLGFILLNFWKYDITIVQVFSYKAFVLESIVILLNKLLCKKIIAVIRGGAFPEFTNKYPAYVKFILRKCNTVVTPSKFVIEELIKHQLSISYIPNFIDQTHFPYHWKSEESNRLLWVRAFHKIYNPGIAVKCIAELRNQYPDITLTMIGPDMGELENTNKLIKDLDLSTNVLIVGSVPNKDLAKYYQTHSVFLTTTSYESFGVSIVEAASCGIPQVATAVGEIPMMWQNGQDILLSDIKDQETFNSNVSRLLNSKELSMNLSKKANKKAKEFTWSFVRMKWLDLLAS